MQFTRRVRSFLELSSESRRAALRRRRNDLLSLALLGWIGARVARVNRFVYLSHVPESVSEYSALPEFGDLVDWWTYHNVRNGGDLTRLLFLVQNAQRVLDERVPGDFAELGVHKGNSAKLLAHVLTQVNHKRRLYLFDTFAGFDSRDLVGMDADRPPLYSDTSLGAVQSFVGADSLCEYRPGHFPETASSIDRDAKFALVHLDSDLYEPTRAALAFFYPRLSSGALVILHDYGSGHWPGVTHAVDEFLADRPERLVLLPDTSGTAVFRKE
jgi:hypothetical protein